ncbi:MAG TPA: hypothetical protein PKM44_16170 [Turneriella sp.]|nr:hypothetical protein [Turneriella sp.]HNE19710.1 hypothetical protein [Turneriella sp.]HNJ67419.1 hypothetical protein [Turneriella sp.]HNL12048.1 hypothetical protein [Turneriella sp.]HNN00568.1 hypothetical protein [Turneriella sp.]
MEMLFIVLVYFSNGNFQSLEVIEMSRAEAELGPKKNSNASCEVALAKPLAALRNKSVKKMAQRKIHYACLGASQVGTLESLTNQSQSWPAVTGK